MSYRMSRQSSREQREGLCMTPFGWASSFAGSSSRGSMGSFSIVGLLLLCYVHRSSSSVSFDYVPHPEFLEKTRELNVTSFIGHTARLPCTIRHLGTKRVSWIRGKDLQVLATGRISFVNDIRISVLPGTGSPKKHKRSLEDYKHPTPMLDPSISRQLDQDPQDGGNSLFYTSHQKDDIRKRRSTLGNPQRYSYYSHLHLKSDGSYEQQHKYVETDPSLAESQPQSSSPNLYARSKRKRNLSQQLPTETSASRGTKTLNASGEISKARNLSADDYQGSILIHPSGSNVMTDDPDSKRTIIPYNYLDDVWEPEDYTLQIKSSQRGDAGEYICQINTEPRMSQTIRLSVVDMVAKIEGSKEFFVNEGSPVTLTCKISHEGVLPGFIFWYKEDRLVDYVNSKGRIEIKTTPEGRSELLLRHAVANDSANYTCEPSGGKPASATLTVIVDVRPAGIQKGTGPKLGPNLLSLLPSALTGCTLKQFRFNSFFLYIFIYSAFPFIWRCL